MGGNGAPPGCSIGGNGGVLLAKVLSSLVGTGMSTMSTHLIALSPLLLACSLWLMDLSLLSMEVLFSEDMLLLLPSFSSVPSMICTSSWVTAFSFAACNFLYASSRMFRSFTSSANRLVSLIFACTRRFRAVMLDGLLARDL